MGEAQHPLALNKKSPLVRNQRGLFLFSKDRFHLDLLGLEAALAVEALRALIKSPDVKGQVVAPMLPGQGLRH